MTLQHALKTLKKPSSTPKVDEALLTLRHLFPRVCFEWTEAWGLCVGIPPGVVFQSDIIIQAASHVMGLDEDYEVAVIIKHREGAWDVSNAPRLFSETSSCRETIGPSIFEQVLDD